MKPNNSSTHVHAALKLVSDSILISRIPSQISGASMITFVFFLNVLSPLCCCVEHSTVQKRTLTNKFQICNCAIQFTKSQIWGKTILIILRIVSNRRYNIFMVVAVLLMQYLKVESPLTDATHSIKTPFAVKEALKARH